MLTSARVCKGHRHPAQPIPQPVMMHISDANRHVGAAVASAVCRLHSVLLAARLVGLPSSRLLAGAAASCLTCAGVVLHEAQHPQGQVQLLGSRGIHLSVQLMRRGKAVPAVWYRGVEQLTDWTVLHPFGVQLRVVEHYMRSGLLTSDTPKVWLQACW